MDTPVPGSSTLIVKLNKNQRVALGVLGVAVAVFVVDKAVLQPGSASASELTATAAGLATDSKLPGSAEHLSANLSVVSAWAESSDHIPADPFGWTTVQEPLVSIDPEASLAETVDGWMLSSIMGTNGNRIAMINGRPVRVNEAVPFGPGDGRFAKIVEIREQSVVLYHNGETVTLKLPVNSLSDVPAARS